MGWEMPENVAEKRTRIRLNCAQLSMKMKVSISPVSELSYAPSLVPKLAPVSELRWFYTPKPARKSGFTAEKIFVPV